VVVYSLKVWPKELLNLIRILIWAGWKEFLKRDLIRRFPGIFTQFQGFLFITIKIPALEVPIPFKVPFGRDQFKTWVRVPFSKAFKRLALSDLRLSLPKIPKLGLLERFSHNSH